MSPARGFQHTSILRRWRFDGVVCGGDQGTGRRGQPRRRPTWLVEASLSCKSFGMSAEQMS